MKHLKTFENNTKKFVLIAYNILDEIYVCIISNFGSKYRFQPIEFIEINSVRTFTAKEIISAKNYMYTLKETPKSWTFDKMIIDELEILLNTKKYNI